MATRYGQSFELERRVEALNSLNIVINWSVKKPPVKLNICDILQPRIIQFGFLSETWKESLRRKLEDNRIKITDDRISNGYLELTVTADFKKDYEAKNQVAAVLLDALKDIICLNIDKKSYKFDKISQEITRMLGSSVFGRLRFFDGKHEACVVGERKAIKRLEEQMKVEKRLPRAYKWPVLEKLEVEKYLNGKNIRVKVVSVGCDVFIRGTFFDAEKAFKELEQFYKSIRKKPVNLNPEEKLCLVFLPDDKENNHLIDLFRKSLNEKRVKTLIETDQGNQLVHVYYIDESEFSKSEGILNECITYHEILATNYEGMETKFEKYEKMRQWLAINEDNKKIKLVCSKDVPANVLIEEVCNCMDISISQEMNEFLELYGKDDMESIAKDNQVTTKLDTGKPNLRIRGTKENIKKFMKDYEKSRCVHSFCIDVCLDLVRKHEDELRRIANSHQCCIQADYSKSVPIWSNICTLVASWSNARSYPNVSLVEGQVEDIQTDYKIMFVTDKLCPMHKCSTDEYGKFLENQEIKEELDVCEVVDYCRNENKCVTKAIVIAKANEHVTLDRKKLGQQFQKVLQEVVTKKAKSVAIPISLIYNDLPIKDLSEIFLSSIHDARAKLDVYLVCHPSEDIKKVALIIHDHYQKMGPGFYRQCHTHDIFLRNRIHHVKTEVEIDSLVDMKVDVIVNTVDPNLEFEKGILSKIILKKAGKSVTEDCKRYYPNGIDFGNLAITGPGDLRNNYVKLIFHCALPVFKKSTFVNDVQAMVKNCFFEMDRLKVKTVAIPAFGTGKLSYPKRETAKAMFDAVEEYQHNCINPSIDRVFFVLYQRDKDTCEIFCDEERRRTGKGLLRVEETSDKNFPELHTFIGHGEAQVKLTVALDEDLKHLPTNVVLTEFKFQKDGGECELKYSSALPSCRYDELKIFASNIRNETALTDAIGRLLKYCKENCIAEVMIPTNNGILLSAAQQINIIATKVVDCAKTKATGRLCQVYVSIPHSEKLHGIEKHLTNEQGSFLSSVKGLFSSKLSWSRNTSHQSSVDIKVIGRTEESIDQVQREITDFTQRIINENEEDVIKAEQENTEPFAKIQCEDDGDELISTENDTVTAELNPGIVSYLKGQHKLELWFEEMMSKFRVKFLNKLGVVEVCGSFSTILTFEKYLEGDFLQCERQNEGQCKTQDAWQDDRCDQIQADKEQSGEEDNGKDKKHIKTRDEWQGIAHDEGQCGEQDELQEEAHDKSKSRQSVSQDESKDDGQEEMQKEAHDKGQDKHNKVTNIGQNENYLNGQNEQQNIPQDVDKLKKERHDQIQDEILDEWHGHIHDTGQGKTKDNKREQDNTQTEKQDNGEGLDNGQIKSQACHDAGQTKFQNEDQGNEYDIFEDKRQENDRLEMHNERQKEGYVDRPTNSMETTKDTKKIGTAHHHNFSSDIRQGMAHDEGQDDVEDELQEEAHDKSQSRQSVSQDESKDGRQEEMQEEIHDKGQDKHNKVSNIDQNGTHLKGQNEQQNIPQDVAKLKEERHDQIQDEILDEWHGHIHDTGQGKIKDDKREQENTQTEKQDNDEGLDNGQIKSQACHDAGQTKFQNEDQGNEYDIFEDKRQENDRLEMHNERQKEGYVDRPINSMETTKDTKEIGTAHHHNVSSDIRKNHEPIAKQNVETERKEEYFHSCLNFKLASIDVVMTETCLSELNVDCIVVPTNERLEAVEFDELVNTAGQEYVKECQKNYRTYGKMSSSECRITVAAGNLRCTKVLHVIEPTWSENSQDTSLHILQNTIEHCLYEADQHEFSSIAIPVIHTGTQPFSKLEGIANIRAIKSFLKYGKHLSKVYISEKDQKKQTILMKALIDVREEKNVDVYGTGYPSNSGLMNQEHLQH